MPITSQGSTHVLRGVLAPTGIMFRQWAQFSNALIFAQSPRASVLHAIIVPDLRTKDPEAEDRGVGVAVDVAAGRVVAVLPPWPWLSGVSWSLCSP